MDVIGTDEMLAVAKATKDARARDALKRAVETQERLARLAGHLRGHLAEIGPCCEEELTLPDRHA